MTRGRWTLGESVIVGKLIYQDECDWWVLVDGGTSNTPVIKSGWTFIPEIEIPTKPYAVIAPPRREEDENSPIVLEPAEDGLEWWNSGASHFSEDMVRGFLACGWRVVFEGVDE